MQNANGTELHIKVKHMNRADASLGFIREVKSEKTCVFISHKKEDQHIAIELGDFLTKQLGVDIYLDVFDPELKEAVSVENDAKIVASIISGLKLSNVLLCIISDKTRLSWWVPYEIGIADNSEMKIASIRTKEIDDFPSFLKTKLTINNLSELVDFILKNRKYGALFYSEQQRNNILQGDVGCLSEYFELGKGHREESNEE